MCLHSLLCHVFHVLFIFLVFSKDIDYYCVIHVSGQGLFSETKGRPKGGSWIKLPFSDSMQDKMLELRRDFWLHNDTQRMVMLSICTKEMNRYVSMFPEVWFIDCIAGEFIHNVLHYLKYHYWIRIVYIVHLLTGTNRQKKQFFVMANRTSSGNTLPGNLTIIPSEQMWVFHAIYQQAFPDLYFNEVCSWNHVVLTDEDDAEYWSFESVIETSQVFSRSKVLICTFHAIWMAFKQGPIRTTWWMWTWENLW